MSPSAGPMLNAFLVCVLLIVTLHKRAFRLGLIDVPTSRKRHETPVPTVGGPAICGGFLIAILLLDSSLQPPIEFLIGLLILALTGVEDDRRGMRAAVKLTLQVLAALVMIVPGGHVITHLEGLSPNGTLTLGVFALPFTVIFIVGLINAINMIDGVDGLAGGIAAATLFWMSVIAQRVGQMQDATALLVLASATLGFLVFNLRHPWRSKAVVFMGDAGSMTLGAAIAFYAVRLTAGTKATVSFAGLMWLVAIPAIDTVSLAWRRMRAGRSPLTADRWHLHHLLLALGFQPQTVTLLLVAACFILGGAGSVALAGDAPDVLHVAGLLGLFAVHAWIVGYAGDRNAKMTGQSPALHPPVARRRNT